MKLKENLWKNGSDSTEATRDFSYVMKTNLGIKSLFWISIVHKTRESEFRIL